MVVSDIEELIVRWIQSRATWQPSHPCRSMCFSCRLQSSPSYKCRYYLRLKYQFVLNWLRKNRSVIEQLAETKNIRFSEAALIHSNELILNREAPKKPDPTSRLQNLALNMVLEAIASIEGKDHKPTLLYVPELWRPHVSDNGRLFGFPVLGGQVLEIKGKLELYSKPVIYGVPISYSCRHDRPVAVARWFGHEIRSK